MTEILRIVGAVVPLLLGCSGLSAEDSHELISALKQGGYVIVFRHGATDDSQKDIYPFNFADMTTQRQLSEQGRDMARQVGAAFKKLHPRQGVILDRPGRRLMPGKPGPPAA